MVIAHYLLWKYAGNLGPLELYYAIAIAAILFGTVEIVDRILKRIRRKKSDQ